MKQQQHRLAIVMADGQEKETLFREGEVLAVKIDNAIVWWYE